jgi:hypothetical protein
MNIVILGSGNAATHFGQQFQKQDIISFRSTVKQRPMQMHWPLLFIAQQLTNYLN